MSGGAPDLCHDWAGAGGPALRGIVDETIRDGLQAPFAPQVDVETKLELVAAMQQTGIRDVIVGMVGVFDDELVTLLSEIRRRGWSLCPWVLSRCDVRDIAALREIAARAGSAVGLNVFISVSDIRMHVEGWNLDGVLDRLREVLRFARGAFPCARVALEDATRARPELLERALRLCLEEGVDRVVIADTSGTMTPPATLRLLGFIRSKFSELWGGPTALEWHGHEDRGLGVANSLAALDAGVPYIHGTILGIGERNGNAALDTILMNAGPERASWVRWDALASYAALGERLFGELKVATHPFFGLSSFASGTGTHCAAIRKAIAMGRPDLARLLFSPDSMLNRTRRPGLLISPLGGRHAACAALEDLGIEADERLTQELLDLAKRERRALRPEEICAVARRRGIAIRPESPGARGEHAALHYGGEQR